MAINFITILFFLPLLAINVNAQGPVTYDITKYGAKPGADISQALMDAWKEASNSTSPSIIVIPRGTWSLSQVKLIGNKAPLELQVQGTVQANPKTGQLPNKDGEWITINYVNYFTLSGGGVFDGQGQEAWKQNDCHKNRNCAKLPMEMIASQLDETKEVRIQNVTCGPGHGISVGSLGGYAEEKDVQGIYVKNCTFIGTKWRQGENLALCPGTVDCLRFAF
ncbi:UNVERIFIED_CONTAM: Polygalacturonase [Sesamum radiatum]|uniref:Polygalacturonase n=1 Tax=Sesamum radiatum TaxID=300843 RepID=A0AAW2V4E2_SESRA